MLVTMFWHNVKSRLIFPHSQKVDATERKQQTVKQGFERSAIKLDQKIDEIVKTHDATM